MNLLLGLFVVLIITLMSKSVITTEIANFSENSISQKSGLQINDKILKVNGMRIFTDMDLSYKLQSDKDGIYDMQVLRNGQKLNLNNIQLQKTSYNFV